jgi:hypothetical protein
MFSPSIAMSFSSLSEDHIAVWFGDPHRVRKSKGGPGGQRPEIWTVPAEYFVPAAESTWHH